MPLSRKQIVEVIVKVGVGVGEKVVVFGRREVVRQHPFIVEDELGKPGPSQKKRFAEYQCVGARLLAVLIALRRRQRRTFGLQGER